MLSYAAQIIDLDALCRCLGDGFRSRTELRSGVFSSHPFRRLDMVGEPCFILNARQARTYAYVKSQKLQFFSEGSSNPVIREAYFSTGAS
jgi:hypothetical protein